ncbi:MAG: acetate/propionate family kinase [Mycoplasmoidaceae bacterium]
MEKKILIINSGSSSLKYSVYDVNDVEICNGLCERIFVDGFFKYKNKIINDMKESNINFPDHDAAIVYLIKFLKEKKIIVEETDILGIGHRVVNGGSNKQSVIIDKKIIKELEAVIPLAPLHNGPAINVIKIIIQKFPNIINVAVFDTSFHTTMPEKSYVYAIPKIWREKYGIRRYGYHGTSYRFIVNKFNQIKKSHSSNLIICHLGNGASICAIENNLSIHTTMGLTPLAGLIMGTRCGDIDPSIHKYISDNTNMDLETIDNILNKESGLLGLTSSSDFRDVALKAENKDHDALLAIDLFTQKIADYIVIYINLLKNKVDAIIFTAGIGENSSLAIEKIFEKIFLDNYQINKQKNNENYSEYIMISEKNSKEIFKIRTNEEFIIANDVKSLTNIKK